MSKNHIILIGIVLVALLVVVFATSQSGTPQKPTFTLPTDFKVETVTADDHIIGNRDAKVVVVEYSDYECPVCGLYAPLFQSLTLKNATTTAYVYRHFPLEQIHPNAALASRAAEAADQQGKFWQYSELLFSKQTDWSNLDNPKVVFEGYATSTGMDLATFDSYYDATSTVDRVQNAFDTAMALKLDHTPTFFVNGKEVVNPNLDPAGFFELLQTKITEARL